MSSYSLEDLISNLVTPGALSSAYTRGLFPQTAIRNTLAVDMNNESDNDIIIYVEAPNVVKESINIDVFNNQLTVSVEKISPHTGPDSSFIALREIKYGKFERKITLPICVTSRETISVSYKDGLIRIRINKRIEEENKFNIGVTVD
jgi:HSP20 family molecular chaperone IbpA